VAEQFPGVHSDPEILGGTPVFVGTPVPVRALLDYLEHHRPLAEFLDDFPIVDRALAIYWSTSNSLSRMRLLLDECVPKRLKRELSGHQVLRSARRARPVSRTAHCSAQRAGNSTRC